MSAGKIHFGADRRPEAVTQPEFFDEPEVMAAIEEAYQRGLRDGAAQATNGFRVFEVCLDGAKNIETVGRRLSALAYIAQFDHDRVKSIRALAALWKVEVSTAFENLTAIRAILEGNGRN